MEEFCRVLHGSVWGQRPYRQGKEEMGDRLSQTGKAVDYFEEFEIIILRLNYP